MATDFGTLALLAAGALYATQQPTPPPPAPPLPPAQVPATTPAAEDTMDWGKLIQQYGPGAIEILVNLGQALANQGGGSGGGGGGFNAPPTSSYKFSGY